MMDGSALGYAELLRLAVSHGLQELSCTVVQFPSDINGQHAVVLATARTTKFAVQTLGEARRDSLPIHEADYALTVAAHRARLRVLCDAVGMPQALDDTIGQFAGVRGDSRRGNENALEDSKRADAGNATILDVAEIHGDAESPRGTPNLESATVAVPDGRQSSTSPAGAAVTASQPISAPTAPVMATHMTPSQSAPPNPAKSMVQTGTVSPEIVSRLIRMTRRKADGEGAPITEEEAMERLNSFFQRAFGHSLSEGTRIEGQRVVQRLASELARLGAEQQASDHLAS